MGDLCAPDRIARQILTAQDLLLSAGFPIEDVESEITQVRRGEWPPWLRGLTAGGTPALPRVQLRGRSFAGRVCRLPIRGLPEGSAATLEASAAIPEASGWSGEASALATEASRASAETSAAGAELPP